VKPWPGIYWIGGSPCSGKSSITGIVAAQHGLRIYHCDDHFAAHVAAAERDTHPRLHWLQSATWDDIFMRPLAELVADMVAIYREEFDLILAELEALRSPLPLLVEGAALLPSLVAPLLSGPAHAVFVIPTGQFQRATYARRPWPAALLAQCRDPQQAWANWMDRDEQFGRYVAGEADAQGLAVLPVDGARTLQQNAVLVGAHFRLNQTGV
jgi:2-phosphoglycerate kinase